MLYWILPALAVAFFLGLFLYLRRQVASMRLASAERRKSAAASAASQAAGAAASAVALAAELSALRQEMDSLVAPPDFAGQELNLNRRTQALRMQRRGESPATIAAALRVPRNEIDLLLKIQSLTGQSQSA
ncbi:conserved exported hypothetical protein [Candidatus Sulfopaludibacter sp. SbA3]|nr:conserved exported hypothetical protein [Candidatus Sulfopaludibacter sp. SbA3]